MSSVNVIVFGASGSVGSQVARSAQSRGANVFLALRDPSKRIPGLEPEQERLGGFKRVRADLLDPDSVTAAAREANATRAFIYAVEDSKDSLMASITGLKSAGVELVVLLSSNSIQVHPRDVPSSDEIPWRHAQVELNLESVFGAGGFIAVRPGFFAYNVLLWKKMLQTGTVKLAYPDLEFDWVSPDDVGRVAGAVLGGSLPDGVVTDKPNIVPVCGPQTLSLRNALKCAGKVVGKDVQIQTISKEEGLSRLVEGGLPIQKATLILDNLAQYAETARGTLESHYDKPSYDRAVHNVELHTGRPATTFEDWVTENKALLLK